MIAINQVQIIVIFDLVPFKITGLDCRIWWQVESVVGFRSIHNRKTIRVQRRKPHHIPLRILLRSHQNMPWYSLQWVSGGGGGIGVPDKRYSIKSKHRIFILHTCPFRHTMIINILIDQADGWQSLNIPSVTDPTFASLAVVPKGYWRSQFESGCCHNRNLVSSRSCWRDTSLHRNLSDSIIRKIRLNRCSPRGLSHRDNSLLGSPERVEMLIFLLFRKDKRPSLCRVWVMQCPEIKRLDTVLDDNVTVVQFNHSTVNPSFNGLFRSGRLNWAPKEQNWTSPDYRIIKAPHFLSNHVCRNQSKKDSSCHISLCREHIHSLDACSQ